MPFRPTGLFLQPHRCPQMEQYSPFVPAEAGTQTWRRLSARPWVPACEDANLSILAIWRKLNTLGLMVRRRAQRAVSNHGSRFRLAAILRDALASLGLLRMRSEW